MAVKKSVDVVDAQDQLNALLAGINKKYGSVEYPIARLGHELIQPGYITTGNLLLDIEAFGGYGYYEGTMTMFTGWPGAGKSQSTKRSIRAAQLARPDKHVAVVAAEKGDYTPEGLHDAGIDPDRLIVIQDLSAEDSLQVLLDLVWDEKNRKPQDLISLWAIDSAAALVPQAELDVAMNEDARRAALAAVFAKFMPKMNLRIGNTAGIIVNQLRKGQAANEKPHSPGGIAIPYLCKTILNFYPYGTEKQKTGEWAEQHDTSMKICVSVEKNNLVRGSKGARTYYTVHLMDDGTHKLGVDDVECAVRAGLILGIIEKSGSWFQCALPGYDPIKSQGLEKLIVAIQNQGLLPVLEDTVRLAAQDRLKKTRMPLSHLMVTANGELIDAAEMEDTARAQTYNVAPLEMTDDDGKVISLEADTMPENTDDYE